jgi:PAS domain S-box-containing protein
MPNAPDITSQLRRELDDTRLRLAEAEETLNAIRNGEVDGLVVAGVAGQQIFTLQGAQEPYRLLIEQMSEGALTLSRDGVILYANQPFAKMLQLPPGHIIGVALRDFVAPADRPALADLLEAALSEHTSEDVSIPIADGTVAIVRLGLNRLHLGEESLLCAVATDITLERKRETDLRHLYENMEAQITERTTDLAASRLAILSIMEEEVKARQTMETANRKLSHEITERQQIKNALDHTMSELERSNRELEQFAYVASHDLQEPLRMVASYTTLLAQKYEGQLDDKAKKYIAYAVDGAVRMQRLINDLLAYSRINTQDLASELTDSNAVLVETVRNLSVVISETGTIVANDDLPAVRVDASRLLLVFQNLISNAIKFRRTADTMHIHVSATDLGHEWRFSVKDNGIGIDMKYAEKIFVIFQRLHTTQEYPGTGIGLAMCKRIVERHGGRIWFESELNKGTTFYFTIPK